MHIQYWKDMLAEAGFKEATSRPAGRRLGFWCDKVQPASGRRPETARSDRQAARRDSSDSFFSFLTFMDAYNVKLVNDSGKLLVDDPAVARD